MIVTHPKVFVIVLTWNHLSDTLECLRSLEGLEYQSYQTVVVDNGSQDNTARIIRETFPNVVIIENERNLGYADGNNVGIRYALDQNAEYIFLLNNDAIVDPTCLDLLVKVANSNPDIGMLCPTIVSYFDWRKTYIGGRMYFKLATGEEIERSPQGLPDWVNVDYAPGCALLVKAEVARRIGLLDPRFFAYFEDTDWSTRCRKACSRVVAVPSARVFHKGTMDQSRNKSPFALYLYRRNQVLFMRKHGHWYDWLQFSRHYVRKSLEQVAANYKEGQTANAEAVIDGCWSGLTGQFGPTMISAPRWIQDFVGSNLGNLLWLTGWLYFGDYQKQKRMPRSGLFESIMGRLRN